MVYAVELDDLRQEIRRNVATTIIFWPKIDGTGNVGASSVAGDNRIEIRNPDGSVQTSETNITQTPVGTVSRFDIAIGAIDQMDEDYHAVLTWRETGTTLARLEAIYFDVVREPWGPSSVSLNSLQSLSPDIVDRLTRQGNRVSQTPEARASVIAHQARIELANWIRQAVSEDVDRMSPLISDTVITQSTDSYLRPRLIKDKTRLHSVEVKIAMALAYAADMRADAEEGDAVAQLRAHFLAEAKSSFSALGPLKYDLSDDLSVDTTVSEINRFIPVRRVQA